MSKRQTMARNKVMTRAEMISTLKSRGQKGALSKMTKPQLKALLVRTAPPGAPSHDEKPRSDIALEPDERQVGGHYYRKNGETKSDGSHEHKSDPWPVSEASKAKSTKKTPTRKRKIDPVEDPDAELTPALVNKRLSDNRHPATGRKLRGHESGEKYRFILRNKSIDGRPVTIDQMEAHLENIDAEFKREFPKPDNKDSGAVDERNVRKGKRGRKEPDRLGDRGPDAFSKEREDEQDGKGMSYHAWMRKHLKQHGGNMAKAAAAYRQQKGGGILDDLERDIGIGGKPRAPAAAAGSAGAPKPMNNTAAGSAGAPKPMSGGHYARADGSVLAKDRGKYGHTHKPGKNPAVTYEDAKSDEPEPARAPSPPARRATRNMDPRERLAPAPPFLYLPAEKRTHIPHREWPFVLKKSAYVCPLGTSTIIIGLRIV